MDETGKNQMDETSGSKVEETREGLVIRLGEGAHLVRLGPSTVVIAEPSRDAVMRQIGGVDGGLTISCVCSGGGGGCKTSIEVEGPSTIKVTCKSDGCAKGCVRWTTEPAIWEVAQVHRALARALTEES